MIFYAISASWLLLGLLSALSIYWLRKMTSRPYTKYNIPPFPVKPWPFIGHFASINDNLRKKMKEWKDNVGSIYSLDFAGQHHIVINDFKDMKEIWLKKAEYIVNTQRSFGDELLGDIDVGLISGRDDNWREQRSTTLTILRSFGVGKNIMAEKIHEEMKVFLDELSDLKGRPEDIRKHVDISISNIICSIAVGKRFEHKDPYFIHLLDLMHVIMQYYFHMMVVTPMKKLYYLPGDILHAKKYYKSTIETNETFVKIFIRKYKEELNTSQEPDNFISAYLIEMNKKKQNGVETRLDEKNLISIVKTLFVAGTDTTSTTILWCLIYMLHYPDIQEKVFDEIDKNVGTARLPTISDKPKLTYLNAVIMEVQRRSSLVPIGFRREISDTFEAFGYTFPKGSILWPALDSVHFDKKIWGDPENFRPARFIDEKGAIINREELIPFGIGRRICPGEALAKMELFLYLSALFQRFRFEPATPGELPSLKEVFGTIANPYPFKLRFIERKH